jgi:hypothetical protein
MKKMNDVLIISLLVLAFGNTACEDPLTDDTILAEITTTEVSNITQSTANTGGSITNTGGGDITEKGICWSTALDPTVDHNKIISSSASNDFESIIEGLTANTAYYVRAYATNSAGIAYGNQQSFTTLQAGDINSKAFNPVPADGATNVPLTTTLAFEINNPALSYYEIFIKKESDEDWTQVTTALNPEDFVLESNTTYVWIVAIVRDIDTDNDYIEADVWTFTTV